MTTYYIDPVAGNSGNSGTSEGAPKSAYSQLTVAAGDVVRFKRGTTHTGAITLTDGVAGAPVTLGAYGNAGSAKPVLTHNGNVLTKNAWEYGVLEDLELRSTSTTSADLRIDRAQFVTVRRVDFRGVNDGWRMEAITDPGAGGRPFKDIVVERCTLIGHANAGLRWVIGTTSGTASIECSNLVVRHNVFDRIGLQPLWLNCQGRSFGVRDHRFFNVEIGFNQITNCCTASVTATDDDQALSLMNIRETALGPSRIHHNIISHCGRMQGAGLIVGLWMTGCTYCIVDHNEVSYITTTTADGGAIFLDANTAAGDEYATNNNLFFANVAHHNTNNKNGTPYTAVQANNSEGFSITRGASGNVFVCNVAYANNIGFHVVGNAQQNYFYHNVAADNDYGWYIQSNTGTTPAGQAQTLMNNIAWRNTVSDVYVISAGNVVLPQETYNLIGVISNDTLDGTSLSADPLYRGGDGASAYRLRAGSPAIAGGSPIAGYRDHAGRRFAAPPSLGAFEVSTGLSR